MGEAKGHVKNHVEGYVKSLLMAMLRAMTRAMLKAVLNVWCRPLAADDVACFILQNAILQCFPVFEHSHGPPHQSRTSAELVGESSKQLQKDQI